VKGSTTYPTNVAPAFISTKGGSVYTTQIRGEKNKNPKAGLEKRETRKTLLTNPVIRNKKDL